MDIPNEDIEEIKLKRKGGQPTSYRGSMVAQSRDLVLLGYTHKRLAEFYNVSLRSILNWKQKYPDFAEALNVERDEYDAKVTRSLFELSTGYNSVETKEESDSNGFSRTVKTSKRMAPNVAAIRTWLFNSRPEQWRSERALSQQTGASLAPAPVLTIHYSLDPPLRGVNVTVGT